LTPLERLRALFQQVLPGNRFYAAKLAGMTAPASLEEFAARVPFTTKAELLADQELHPPFGSNLTFPLSAYTRFCQTSATSGRKPLRWLDTPESWQWLLRNWTRVFSEAGVTSADRVFCAFSFGPFLGFWTAFEAAAQMGCLVLPGGGMASGARLQMLLDLEATVLCATPTYAIHLGQAAATEGVDLARSKIRRIMVAGEPGGSVPAVRARVEALWPGAVVMDHHGMTEVGPVTYSRVGEPEVLRVMGDAYLAEVIDPASGRAVPRGETGELVLTNFGRLASPLVRYRTGDLVREALEAAPGEMALAGGILGRADDMVVVRGVNVFPAAVEEIVRGCGHAGEFRVLVGERESLTELTVELEGDAALAQRVAEELRNTLTLRIPVMTAPAGSLPRFELKARRWVRQEGAART